MVDSHADVYWKGLELDSLHLDYFPHHLLANKKKLFKLKIQKIICKKIKSKFYDSWNSNILNFAKNVLKIVFHAPTKNLHCCFIPRFILNTVIAIAKHIPTMHIKTVTKLSFILYFCFANSLLCQLRVCETKQNC